MRQLQIQAAEEGQRLDKYLSRYMPEAPKSFFYKMLRKRTLPATKKCDGSEKLCAGDCIELFWQRTRLKNSVEIQMKKSFQHSDTDSKRIALTKEHYI